MTRKDFEVIAGILAKLDPISMAAQGYKQALIEHFAEELQYTNPNFNAERFITACNAGNMGKGRSHKNVKAGGV